MDIDDALYELREALSDLRDGTCHDVEVAIEQVIDLFDGMDSWFIKGGYLPEDWSDAHPIN